MRAPICAGMWRPPRPPRHFLERLVRLPPREGALARALAADAGFVQYLWDAIRPCWHEVRIAISLAHTERGPYVIVDRAGRFITCLARGMHADPHRVVPRRTLYSVRERYDATRRW
jgi:hypothetical protein